MTLFAVPALVAGLLLGLGGAANAQQQAGQMQNLPGMDHSRMQGMDQSNMAGMNMQGMDHSNMPGMQGNGSGGRTAAPMRPSRPGTQTQPRTN